jgi:hypothetical protein
MMDTWWRIGFVFESIGSGRWVGCADELAYSGWRGWWMICLMAEVQLRDV